MSRDELFRDPGARRAQIVQGRRLTGEIIDVDPADPVARVCAHVPEAAEVLDEMRGFRPTPAVATITTRMTRTPPAQVSFGEAMARAFDPEWCDRNEAVVETFETPAHAPTALARVDAPVAQRIEQPPARPTSHEFCAICGVRNPDPRSRVCGSGCAGALGRVTRALKAARKIAPPTVVYLETLETRHGGYVIVFDPTTPHPWSIVDEHATILGMPRIVIGPGADGVRWPGAWMAQNLAEAYRPW